VTTICDAPCVALTDRQRHVLRLVCDGATDRQIAAHIEASIRTVQREIAYVRAVLGAPSRAAMIASAVRAGAVEPSRPDELVAVLASATR
jgi:DNA-binding CsgD family transcriptional regulator